MVVFIFANEIKFSLFIILGFGRITENIVVNFDKNFQLTKDKLWNRKQLFHFGVNLDIKLNLCLSV